MKINSGFTRLKAGIAQWRKIRFDRLRWILALLIFGTVGTAMLLQWYPLYCSTAKTSDSVEEPTCRPPGIADGNVAVPIAFAMLILLPDLKAIKLFGFGMSKEDDRSQDTILAAIAGVNKEIIRLHGAVGDSLSLETVSVALRRELQNQGVDVPPDSDAEIPYSTLMGFMRALAEAEEARAGVEYLADLQTLSIAEADSEEELSVAINNLTVTQVSVSGVYVTAIDALDAIPALIDICDRLSPLIDHSTEVRQGILLNRHAKVANGILEATTMQLDAHTKAIAALVPSQD